MTRFGIEPWFSRLLANTLTTIPMGWNLYINKININSSQGLICNKTITNQPTNQRTNERTNQPTSDIQRTEQAVKQIYYLSCI